VHFTEEFADPALQQYSQEYQQEQFQQQFFNNGLLMPLTVSFVQETTVFREYGPLSGSTMRLSFEVAPKVGNSLSRTTVDGDARYYMRLGGNGVLALRAYGFKSMGSAPNYTIFGGNSEMRGYEYREFLGHKGFYTNAELRFPLINAHGDAASAFSAASAASSSRTMAGRPRRAHLQDMGQQHIRDRPAPRPERRHHSAPAGHPGIPAPRCESVLRPRHRDIRARLPIHLDWSYRTLFNKDWEKLPLRQQRAVAQSEIQRVDRIRLLGLRYK
jgi:hypothetical protein